jgi:hypothetical protein
VLVKRIVVEFPDSTPLPEEWVRQVLSQFVELPRRKTVIELDCETPLVSAIPSGKQTQSEP